MTNKRQRSQCHYSYSAAAVVSAVILSMLRIETSLFVESFTNLNLHHHTHTQHQNQRHLTTPYLSRKYSLTRVMNRNSYSHNSNYNKRSHFSTSCCLQSNAKDEEHHIVTNTNKNKESIDETNTKSKFETNMRQSVIHIIDFGLA